MSCRASASLAEPPRETVQRAMQHRFKRFDYTQRSLEANSIPKLLLRAKAHPSLAQCQSTFDPFSSKHSHTYPSKRPMRSCPGLQPLVHLSSPLPKVQECLNVLPTGRSHQYSIAIEIEEGMARPLPRYTALRNDMGPLQTLLQHRLHLHLGRPLSLPDRKSLECWMKTT